MEKNRRHFRWLRTSGFTEAEFRAIQDRLIGARYGKKLSIGFLTKELTPNFIRATYVERRVRKSSIIGPLGETQNLEWFEFTTFEFVFDRRRSLVEVTSTARNMRPLTQQLGQLTEWKASFEPLILNPKVLMAFLVAEGIRFDIEQIEATDLTLSANTSAAIIASGKGAVKRDLDALTGRRKYEVASVVLVVTLGTTSFGVGLTRNGRLSLEHRDAEIGTELFRRALLWEVRQTEQGKNTKK